MHFFEAGLTRKHWIAAGGVATALALAAFFVLRGSSGSSSTLPTTRSTRATVRVDETRLNTAPKPNSRTRVNHTTDKNNASSVAATWTAKFRVADDYFKFVDDALPAALKGDGRAAWYIGEALTSCALVMKTYHGSADPEAQLNQELANMPKAPQWARDLLAQKTHRCLGLAREDPFESLPHRERGYTYAYWYDQALADGDPLAQEQAATKALTAISVTNNMPEGAKADKLKIAETNLRAVVESGDPDALFNAGMLLSDFRYSNNPLNGIAVALAACELGHDCSADNSENVFSRCKLTGECAPDADYAYFMQQSLGPDKYAQVYARAQQVKQFFEAGDWNAVLDNLKIDKHP